ncbi:hypothetical protein Bbelb_091610 [Branchiostoma belcheri]|nr:hypothetical protein Bbelb_091610 [Branchiostoma belcheri]
MEAWRTPSQRRLSPKATAKVPGRASRQDRPPVNRDQRIKRSDLLASGHGLYSRKIPQGPDTVIQTARTLQLTKPARTVTDWPPGGKLHVISANVAKENNHGINHEAAKWGRVGK